MRIIIGILAGLLLAFNWSTVRGWVDHSLDRPTKGPATDAVVVPAVGSPGAAAPAPSVKPVDLGGAVEGRLKEIAAGHGK